MSILRRLLPSAAVALLLSCEAPDELGYNALDLGVFDGSEATNAFFIAVAESAESTLDVALESLDDVAVAEAMLDAHDRGVDVRVVVDFDHRDGAGVQLLTDAGLPVTLADDGISYFDFVLNRDVTWSSEDTRMTHHFAIGDGIDIAMATLAGDTGGGERVVLHGLSEDVGQDMGFEHNQVYGGSDAVETTFYDDLAKSPITNRHDYPLTGTGDVFELWQGPQHRTAKRIIDAAYQARANIWVLTEDLVDPGLADILNEKTNDGFDVKVIVGSSFTTSFDPDGDEMSDTLVDARRAVLEQARRVDIRQVQSATPLPTVVLYDTMKARDGGWHTPRAYVSTQPIYSAGRLFFEREILTDQLMDDTLIVLRNSGAPGSNLQSLIELFEGHDAQAEALP